jgi:hypothetical protein
MKFGRRARQHNPAVPHWSLIAAYKDKALPPLPSMVSYARVLPFDLGYFANNVLSDCTTAAVYHALQVWSANANPPMDTESDANVIQLYSEATGYIPGKPQTDQGGSEQDVLTYWMNAGAPVGPAGSARQRLAAFVEIDPRNLADVKEAILQGGLIYIGFQVPAFFSVGSTLWDVNPDANNTIVDGHAVILVGYNDALNRFTAISWGRQYEMTYAFFLRFTDECYLLANSAWIETTGATPAGLSLPELEVLMGSLKWGGGQARFKRRRHRRMKKQQGRRPALG